MEVLQTSINHVFAVLSDECIYNLPQFYPNGRPDPKASLKDAKDYESLYIGYGDRPASAQGLDQEMARVTLQTGKAPTSDSDLGPGAIYLAADCGIA